MERIKVLIVDDHALIRKGLRELLSIEETLEVVGDVADGDEAVKTAKLLKPHLVLMDLRMPRCNGIEATRRLQAEMPEVRVLINTGSEEEADLSAAIESGAKGYILKTDQPALLANAIQYVVHGGIMVAPSMTAKLMPELEVEQPGVVAQKEGDKQTTFPGTANEVPDTRSIEAGESKEGEAAVESITEEGVEDALDPPGSVTAAVAAADSLQGEVELVISSPVDPTAIVKLYG